MLTGKNLLQEVQETKPQRGNAAFWWLGQQGYIVKTGDITLVFDPYLNPAGNRLIPPLFNPEDLTFADFIFGSHDHGDHIDHFAYPLLAKSSKEAFFVVPALSVQRLSKNLKIEEQRFIGMTDSQVYSCEKTGVTITAIAAAHEFLDQDEDTGLYPYLSFVVEANGVRIYHAGDTCRYEGLETKLIELRPLDIMFVPINGRDGRKYRSGIIGNMDFREAVDLCGMVEPELSVPGHYDMFENNTADPIEFVNFIEAKYPMRRFFIGGHGVKTMLDIHRM